MAEAGDVAQRMRLRIAEATLRVENALDIRLTVSCGLATTLPTRVGSVTQAVEEADRALYQAKRMGWNRICWAVGSSLSAKALIEPRHQ